MQRCIKIYLMEILLDHVPNEKEKTSVRCKHWLGPVSFHLRPVLLCYIPAASSAQHAHETTTKTAAAMRYSYTKYNSTLYTTRIQNTSDFVWVHVRTACAMRVAFRPCVAKSPVKTVAAAASVATKPTRTHHHSALLWSSPCCDAHEMP